MNIQLGITFTQGRKNFTFRNENENENCALSPSKVVLFFTFKKLGQ